MTDYYSRYPEVAQLGQDTSSAEVISHMKGIFARHSIPETVISDNGPQYASHEFKEFARDYKFRSVTASPRYPKANGAAERMVQTIKHILKKSDDPYLGLLAYRTAPLQSGFSPSELLMNRQLRTNLGQVFCERTTVADHKQFKRHNDRYKDDMKQQHDGGHRVKELSLLQPGDGVYIRDMDREGTVTSTTPGTRSYLVATSGSTVRRNRAALVPTPVVQDDQVSPEVEGPVEAERSPSSPPGPEPDQVSPEVEGIGTPPRSRAGRSCRGPRRLIEEI